MRLARNLDDESRSGSFSRHDYPGISSRRDRVYYYYYYYESSVEVELVIFIARPRPD